MGEKEQPGDWFGIRVEAFWWDSNRRPMIQTLHLQPTSLDLPGQLMEISVEKSYQSLKEKHVKI